ncbi:hypothetical protein MGN70_007049 [Eutypa lata]|nr:hypothetical protein MGN70_007049 [Eutypa lata]
MSPWSKINNHILRAKGAIKSRTHGSSSGEQLAVPSLPLELWVKIIRYIADCEDGDDPIDDMVLLWLRARAVSHHVRAAVDLVFQDIYLKQIFIGQANTVSFVEGRPVRMTGFPFGRVASPDDRTVQITWFPYDRLATATKEGSRSGAGAGDGERAVFASNDFWGGRFGSAATPSSDTLQPLAVWLPPNQAPGMIRIADVDVKYTQREVAVYWRDVFSSYVPLVARRRARETRLPQPRPRFHPGSIIWRKRQYM